MPNNDIDGPRTLTFSQTQGYEVLPSLLALEELSDDARRELWDLLYVHTGSDPAFSFPTKILEGVWLEIAIALHREFRKRPLEDFDASVFSFQWFCKEAIFEGEQPFNKVFDILQIIMRHPRCPVGFVERVQAIFVNNRMAYYVDVNGPATIFPMATRQEGAAIRDAIDTFHIAGLVAPEKHLRKAAEFINQGDWPGSIRESINSVESIARLLAPESAKTLSPALKSLEADRKMHPALRSAFEKLYGYTSDEEGIRHPLMSSGQRQLFWPLYANYFGRSGSGVIVVCNCRSCASLVR